ncbi:MAG: acyl-CoA thioesterase [Acidobacteriota bacterium]|nr:acyl-CoA thioesterase [Acidobacteriota bacterium]
MAEFVMQRRVEFVDTDMGGIVHFSRYPIFMETAEHCFLESLGWSVNCVIDGCHIGWPRVSFQCDYLRPLRFGQTFEVVVTVLRRGSKSVTYGFVLREGGEDLAKGSMTSVCCHLLPDQSVRSLEIPEKLAAQLDTFVVEGGGS